MFTGDISYFLLTGGDVYPGMVIDMFPGDITGFLHSNGKMYPGMTIGHVYGRYKLLSTHQWKDVLKWK
jgi:hypothetical protein